jgi:hypothetical protein
VAQIGQESDQVRQFRIVRIVEPAADWYGVAWIEDIRGGAIVEDDGLVDWAAEAGKVLWCR